MAVALGWCALATYASVASNPITNRSPSQNPSLHPEFGFQYSGFSQSGRCHGEYPTSQPPFVPQPFEQPHVARQPYRTYGYYNIRPEQGGFTAHNPVYRRGRFEYDTHSDFIFPEGPGLRGPSHHSHTSAQAGANDSIPASPGGYNQPHAQRPSETDLPTTGRPQARKATSEDAIKHKIPPHFCLENWNPDEEAIIFSGSVFDANSMGRWIYKWTAACRDKGATETATSAEFWFLIVQVAQKLQLCTRFVSQSEGTDGVGQDEQLEMVTDFIQAGNRLMDKFQTLMTECEKAMYEPGKKDTLRREAGMVFVDVFFSPTGHKTTTNSLVEGMRIWLHRWRVNCGFVMDIKPDSDTEQTTEDVVDDHQDLVL